MRQRLASEIDARREELVAFTRELIRIPTVNPPGDHYRDICELLRARLET
ncbi:MAG TPA: succinyl-diaminopimelate desuccinylase, partial [Alphaproteobacteria bacterium]|nr:succinyl-diaminopimelate desuccinylase [Alphaproteobacteria bacterium]